MKLNRNHSRSQAQFQARLEAQYQARRTNIERVTDLSTAGPSHSLFKSSVDPTIRSIDDLVVAGNRSFEELDNIDFAGFRNNERLGERTLREVETQLAPFHADRTSPAFKKDLSRVLNARYLQGHGVQVEAHLDAEEMRDLRKYFQRETSTYNVADAARSINASLASGLEDVQQLKHQAERHLFAERGLAGELFEQKFADLTLDDLAKTRNFSDAWSTSQGGKVLQLAQGQNFEQTRDSMARGLLSGYGYQNVDALDLDTTLSVLRDIDSEGPRTNATIRDAINRAITEKERDYFVLNTRANLAILRDIGVSEKELQDLRVDDESLRAAYPDTAPRESRATRTKVLRDLLRALPAKERKLAQRCLANTDSNLIKAEADLGQHFAQRISALTGDKVALEGMGAMQRANFTSALSKLPEALRLEAFAGGENQTKQTLEREIEGQFGVEVHRRAGSAPDGNDSVAPFVKDWTIQGLVDLYNAMNGMAKDGQLPQTLIQNSTIAYVEGSGASPSMAVGPAPLSNDPVGPWDQPGAWAHDSGQSGYFGMCSPDETGHDTVYFCDDALKGTNGDSANEITIGESTIIHEFGHAIQLGGTPGADAETRMAEQQLLMAEWSSLSRWTEPQNVLADGMIKDFEYYYDPTVQVAKREEVATSYGASDPCEDFAEYTPYFFKAPEVAMELSAEKFLYLNAMVGDFYSPEQISQVAERIGLSAPDIKAAESSMVQKVASAPKEANLQARSA